MTCPVLEAELPAVVPRERSLGKEPKASSPLCIHKERASYGGGSTLAVLLNWLLVLLK